VKVPACSTIHAILDRPGLVTRAKRSRTHTEGTPLSSGLGPNALYSTDYKGEFKLGNSTLLLSADRDRSRLALLAAVRGQGIQCGTERSQAPQSANLLQQQAKFDAFLEEFNNERPHEGLDMKCQADVYTASAKPIAASKNRSSRSTIRPSSSPTAASLPVSQEDQLKHLSGWSSGRY
jgi:hypothetical protein